MAMKMPCVCTNFDRLMTICVKAGRSAPKPLNSALELRDHEDQQDDRHDDGDDQHRGRIEQRLLDLLLQGLPHHWVARRYCEES